MLTTTMILGVFLGALVSGWHCALMCGGIASAIEGPTTHTIIFQSPKKLFLLQLIMHMGRLTTYTLLGALAAWIGMRLWQQDIVAIQRPLFALTALLLIVMGIRLLRQDKVRGFGLGNKWGGILASYWSRYLGDLGRAPTRWFSGMLWGLVPCGLVYSVLPLSFLSGNVFTGGLLMLAFGLGTLPNLLLISKLSAVIAQFGRYIWVRFTASTLFICSGLFGLYRAWELPQSLLKQGFCLS